MPDLVFAVPGGLDLPTGGATYDRKTIAALRDQGWTVDVRTWPGSFPFPDEADRRTVTGSLASLPDDMLVIIDGLALGTLPDLARAEARRLRLVALVHHPLALEAGLPEATAVQFAAEEREALRWVRAVIVTSTTTAAILQANYGVTAEQTTVALPGIPRPAEPTRARETKRVNILSMGQIVPRKAFHILVEALAGLKDLDFTCIIAGDRERDPDSANALAAQIVHAGLSDRVTLTGNVDEEEAARLRADADLFAFPSLYEGYGMALAEALAWGLPVVATTGGAIPEVVPPDAGILVPPGDAIAFREALRALMSDTETRLTLARGARAAASRLNEWDATARCIAATLERL